MIVTMNSRSMMVQLEGFKIKVQRSYANELVFDAWGGPFSAIFKMNSSK